LGGFQVACDGAPITQFHDDKVRALLAYLAVEADRSHARASLAALLWPEQPDAVALNNLSQTLVRLRAALGAAAADALLQITRQAIQWRPASADVDMAAFARLSGSRDVADLARAADLYRGEFLAGFGLPGCEAFEEWLLLMREQLKQQALAVLHTLADQHLTAGRYAEAADAARRQLALEPWHEPAQRQLMRGLALAGDRRAALAAYDHCRAVLAHELGIEPESETAALAERIRAGDLTPATRDVAAPRTICRPPGALHRARGRAGRARRAA
jgi:DNA-binding SARP family transcriptional activator